MSFSQQLAAFKLTQLTSSIIRECLVNTNIQLVIRTFTSKSDRYYLTLRFNPLKIELLRIEFVPSMLWQDGDQVIAYRQKAIVIFTKGDMVGIENVMHKVQDEICIKRVL